MSLIELIKQGSRDLSCVEWELTEDGTSPIIWMVRNYADVTLLNSVLFKFPEHVNDVDKEGNSALYYAAICNNFCCRVTYFAVLHGVGGNLNQVQGNGLTVRQYIRENQIESLYGQL